MKIAQQTLPNLWAASDTGTHVPLPLDVSAVPDAVVEKVARVIHDVMYHESDNPDKQRWQGGNSFKEDAARAESRAAIAALAAALGEEG